MSLKKIFLLTLFFSIVPLSSTMGNGFPVRDDVKFDDIQVNNDDFKPKEADKKEKKKPVGKTMIANCKDRFCPESS